MKILKLLAIAAMIIGGAITASAQTAAEVKATQVKMMNAKTPCNGGPEAFSTFIQKFNSDPAFLAERLAVSDADRAKYADILTVGNFAAMTPVERDNDGMADEYYQAWGELQYNKAYLECGWVDSYCTHTFEFVRNAAGKWTLGKVVPGE